MIVVTGAAGFIGSNIVAELEEQGIGPVAAVDWLGEDERWRNLAGRMVSDFVHPEDLWGWLDAHGDAVRGVVHMGAISATTERNVDRLLALNIQYSLRLWDWCAAHEVPFIYASSAATYGGIEEGFLDDESVPALNALRPLNAYGWSKKVVDLAFTRKVAAGERAPPQWVGLKFFNVYGPNEYHKGDMMSVACKLYGQVTAGERPRLFRSYRDGVGDGEQRRDFVYVKDCARIVARLLRRPDISGIYNIGTGQPRSFLDVVKAMGRVVNRPVEVEFIDMPEAIRDRYQYYTAADTAKLEAARLGTGFLSLEEGIADYVTGYLSREQIYR